jgi:glycerophosphoryl diester phosphodiesterase
MTIRTPAWIAHAGLGIAQPGGSPTARTLNDAVRVGVDRVELDVCATADAALVLRHDCRTPVGRPVESRTLNELRRDEPTLLTLDEALDHLAALPVLLDVKTVATAAPLGRWLRRRRDPARFTVCTEILPALTALRDRAPRVERWRSFPDVGTRRPEYVTRVAAQLLRHARPAHAGWLARELSAAALQARTPHGRTRVAGAPWRRLLPANLDRLASECGAAGISVHHSVVSPQLMGRATGLRLPVVAWTVNSAAALAHVVRCGVDMVTTDDVAGMRIALGDMAAAPV